mmetsp:Transcript_101899/g.293472  ORF Transcript_101899/g.293472 Transcript_101899/m.293472 type:complete len:147 (-) Transcript_101899:48-488(-)
MNAVKALKTNQREDAAIKAAEEVLKAPRTVSIHDVLKAEMDAAKIMKKTSSEADVALSAPLSNGSSKNKEAPAGAKPELKTKSKGETDTTIENANENKTENAKSEDKPQNKKRKRKKKNKNKGATMDAAGVNGLSNIQINGQEKEP